MERTLKGSLLTLGAMVLIASVMVGIGVATPEGTVINDIAIGVFITMLCASSVVILTSLVSGIATLINYLQGNTEKKKNDFAPSYSFNDDNDMQLDDIMDQLSPEQQAYLENKLSSSRLGVGNDGELVSINELLNDFDEFEGKM